MDLKRDYENLYQHWVNEFQISDLTKLTQRLFDKYNELLKAISDHQEDKADLLRFQLFASYKDNITFLFEDLMKIREIKIINTALSLKEIDIDNVIEAEKLLYQNLISSIKGYQKVKAISVFDEEKYLKKEVKPDLKAKKLAEIIKSEIIVEDLESKSPKITHKSKKDKINLILLRFLKKTPPLVGIDLLNYGPFEKEDVAYIPSQNAKILIFEKFAEKMEID
ncbi:MAG: DNA replication complex subunit Gins51 [Promethearchaeota archaeon]|jgi:DNA replication initiation complex subunit (GINS family)